MLFSPLRFTASALVKALQIYRRGTERITDLPWETLKKEVTVAVEKEVSQTRLPAFCVFSLHLTHTHTHRLILTFFSACFCYVSYMYDSLPLQLQSSVTEFEFSQEEYRQLQVEFWSKFYTCCLQYQEALATPLGLLLNPHTHMVCVLKKVQIGRETTFLHMFS